MVQLFRELHDCGEIKLSPRCSAVASLLVTLRTNESRRMLTSNFPEVVLFYSARKIKYGGIYESSWYSQKF